MGIGNVIKCIREEKMITQEKLAARIGISNRTISAIENNSRGVSLETLQLIIDELNDSRLYIEAINCLTDGVFGINLLNGSKADLHRSCVKDKVTEELEEAINAIKISKLYQNPKGISEKDRELIKESVNEVIDVYKACGIYINVICKEYDFDVKEMFQQQEQKMIAKGYLNGSKQKSLKQKNYR